MNVIKVKWDPAATGVNKDCISNDFAINYEDIHKMHFRKQQLPWANLGDLDENSSLSDTVLECSLQNGRT